MKVLFGRVWEEIRFSYWFLPAVMAVLAVALSFVMIRLDQYYRIEWVQSTGWVWSGGAEGARGLLSTVVGSMITVVSLTFSITIVAFSQASSQFGPRLLRSLMKDTGNQLVLGTFTATFIYCLLVLRTVRSGADAEFTPNISVTLGIVMALVSLGVLIYFIHHVALSIQAPYLVANVAGDLLATIDRLFPDPQNEVEEDEIAPTIDLEKLREDQTITDPVLSEHNGYLQGIDFEGLLEVAVSQELILVLLHRPGHFISEGTPLVATWPNQRLGDEVKKKIETFFSFGPVRTYTQDVEFAIDQLVEVAVRALSPGINDPFTAVTCIDWLGVALKRLASKSLAQSWITRDKAGNLRVIMTKPVTFEGAVEAAFNQIRQNARSSVAVRIRLLETIVDIMQSVQLQSYKDALLQEARIIADISQGEVPGEKDQKDIADKLLKIDKFYNSLTPDDRLEKTEIWRD